MWEIGKRSQWRRQPVMTSVLAICAVLVSACSQPAAAPVVSVNAVVLQQVKKMPSGGGYSTTKATDQLRQRHVTVGGGQIQVDAQQIKPSYCSGATYLVFLATLNELNRQGAVSLSAETLKRLAVADAKDGELVWGRWNANGPGTAKLFADTGLGENFTDLGQARPGDFLKIFWTDAVGKFERGHSVVYLGHSETHISFWSSNEDYGYGRKSVPLARCKHLLFSRLSRPDRINSVMKLPSVDPYLLGMLRTEHTRQDMLRVVLK